MRTGGKESRSRLQQWCFGLHHEHSQGRMSARLTRKDPTETCVRDILLSHVRLQPTLQEQGPFLINPFFVAGKLLLTDSSDRLADEIDAEIANELGVGPQLSTLREYTLRDPPEWVVETRIDVRDDAVKWSG